MSCTKEVKPRVESKDGLYLFLDTLEQRYESACSAMELARWNFATKEAKPDFNSARELLAEIFLDTSIRNIISEWRGRSGSLADKPLARRLELWHRAFLGGSIEYDDEVTSSKINLANKFSKIQIAVNGKNLTGEEVLRFLQTEKNSKKRKIYWQAYLEANSKYLNEYRKTVQLLNTKAQAKGFPSYYSFVLYMDGIDEGKLLKTFAMLKELTCIPSEKITSTNKRKQKSNKTIAPWDAYYFGQTAKQLPEKYFPTDSLATKVYHYFDSTGFNPDSIRILTHSKNNHAKGSCFRVAIPKDIRITFPIKAGQLNYADAFAAYAYGLKAFFTQTDFPILKSYTTVPGTYCSVYNDGIALMMHDLLLDSLWLRTFTKVKEKELKQFYSKRTEPQIVKLIQEMKAFETEYEFFKNPSLDTDSLERVMLEKYYDLSIDSGITTPMEINPTHTDKPGGSYKAIIIKLIAAQLEEALFNKFGSREHTDSLVAAWMIDRLFLSGEKIEWQERMRNATGKSVEPGPYLRKIGIEHSTLLSNNNLK
ncbi:MAG: M2 family metallopeptidase [Ignavibacteriales bacterium]|nr:M2 family metallopeptidase [Ignavibacteriales bacterium]